MSNTERIEVDSASAITVVKAALSELDMDNVRRIAVEIEYEDDESEPEANEPPQLPERANPSPDDTQRWLAEEKAAERSESASNEREITSGHSAHEVLTAVHEAGYPVESSDLKEQSDRFTCSESSITSILARLHDNGLVSRTRSRPHEYELTDDGHEFLYEHGPAVDIMAAGLEPGSTQHRALSHISEADDPVSSLDLAESGLFDDAEDPDGTASASLSALHRKRLVRRVGTVGTDNGWAYAYEISPFGEKQLTAADEREAQYDD